MKRTYGEQIALLRAQKGMTSKELAGLCGQETQYMEEIESGKRELTIPLMLKVCKLLNTSPDFLLEGYLEEKSSKQELMYLCRQLPDEDIRVILHVVEDIFNKQNGVRNDEE